MYSKIIARVRELAEPIINEQNLELVDIEYSRGKLRITIDQGKGVALNDCTRISKEVGYILEIRDVITHPYHLEVSSPGLERPLKTPGDFENFLGRKVNIITSELLNGQRNFRGTLKLVQDGNVHLDIEGKYWEIPLTSIGKAKLIYEFLEKG
ncbi:MAG: ribosome maturation factor RimP [Deltaproteobacteria bacterium]|nr:ribosome maturation factor RimP [Deltaproteobacteria bacterium]